MNKIIDNFNVKEVFKEEHSELILNVMEFLKQTTLNNPRYFVTLAGGFLRDCLEGFGNGKPKDVDIFLAPISLGDAGLMDIATVDNIFYVKASHEITDMQERGVNYLIGGTEDFGKLPEACQYIVYKQPMTSLEVLKDLDFSLCQIGMYYCVLRDQFILISTSDFDRTVSTGKVTMGHTYAGWRMQKRYQRMLNKYPTLDYSQVEEHLEAHRKEVQKNDSSGFWGVPTPLLINPEIQENKVLVNGKGY